MQLLLLLALVGLSTAAAVYQMPVVKIDSPRVRMMRQGIWQNVVKQRNAARLKMNSVARAPGDKYEQKVVDYYDKEYIGNITVGTPEQTFRVVLDTGSADFWIPDISCVPPPKIRGCEDSFCDPGASCAIFCPKKDLCCKTKPKKYTCKGKNVYNPEDSYSSEEFDGNWTVKYGSGSASGIYALDTVRFGEGDANNKNLLRVPETVVGRATQISEFFNDVPFDGVLGLAFQSIASNPIVKPPFANAYDLGVVDPVFTVHLRHGEGENIFGGVYTYGGIDTVNCERDVVYEPLTETSYWQFKLKSISIGGFQSTLGWQAVSMTGSAFIAAPKSIADAMAKAVDAEYNPEEDAYFLDCDGFPKPQFGIGQHIYRVEGYNFMIKIEELKCILTLYGMDGGAFGPSWILGDPFIRQFCNIHDMKEKRIGFARSLQKQ